MKEHTRIMKPWDVKRTDGLKFSDQFLIPLWEPFKPKDFYFAIQSISVESESGVIVYVVPKEFYETNGLMYEDSMPIIQYIPSYLDEIMDCIYETSDKQFIEVKEDLIRTGFINDHYFQKSIDDCNGIFANFGF